MRYSRPPIYILLLIVLASTILLNGCTEQPIDASDDLLYIQYFYDNICGSCDPEAEFIEQFEDLTGISHRTPNLRIDMYNVYVQEGEDQWSVTSAQYNIPSEKHNFPIMIMDDTVYYLNDIDTVLQNELPDQMPQTDTTIPANASIIYYFTSPGCHDCALAEESTISQLPESIIINDTLSPVHLVQISTAQKGSIELFQQYCNDYKVPDEKRTTPIAFAGYTYYSGPDEIIHLMDSVESGDAMNTPILSAPTAPDDDALGAYGLWGVIATGLLNGLNPCAISMVLMLLSLIVVNRRWIIPVGLAFALGKFMGFLILGTLLFKVIDQLPLAALAKGMKIFLLIFSSVMILLNFNDFIAAKNERYQNIILQLPTGFRRKNHQWIRMFAAVKSKGLFIVSGFLLGLLLSAGEFLCTGQIYLAVIVQVVHSTTQLSGKAFMYLIVYCAMFVVPLILLTLLVAKGRKVLDISEKFRQNMTWVKLLNILIFIVFFGLVWFLF